MKLNESLKKVAEIWHKECLKLSKPLSESQIIEKHAKLNVPISQDVIEVYSTLGGMEDCEMDSECFSFWDIDKILEENKPNSEFIYFADFLIDSHHYAFKFENEYVSSIYVHYSEKDRPKVGDSFAEFFELYLNDILKLFI
jgi:hypothetical protein